MKRAELVEQLRADYLQRMERIAEQLRPRFEAGELRGFNDNDERAIEKADRKWRQEHPRSRRTSGTFERCPAMKLENEMVRRLRLVDERNACFVLALSPSSEAAAFARAGHDTILFKAETVASWDVLRIARARHWYKPHRSEEPSAAELRGEKRKKLRDGGH